MSKKLFKMIALLLSFIFITLVIIFSHYNSNQQNGYEECINNFSVNMNKREEIAEGMLDSFNDILFKKMDKNPELIECYVTKGLHKDCSYKHTELVKSYEDDFENYRRKQEQYYSYNIGDMVAKCNLKKPSKLLPTLILIFALSSAFFDTIVVIYSKD